MSFHNLTWDAYNGIEFAIGQIEDALEAHPAWKFIEEVLEEKITPASSPDPEYVSYDYSIRVWKSEKVLNGKDVDFYIALIYAKYKNEYGPNYSEKYFHVIGMEDYDLASHRPIKRIGFSVDTWDNPVYSLDPEGNITFPTDELYPFFEPIVEEGATWGTWYARGKTSSVPSPLTLETDHIMSVTGGSAFSVALTNDSSEPLSPGEKEYNLVFQLTKNSLLVSIVDPMNPYGNYMIFVGAMDFSSAHDEIKPKSQFMFWGSDDYAFRGYGMCRMLSTNSLPWLSEIAPGFDPTASHRNKDIDYSWGFDSGIESEDDRKKFILPGIDPYVVVPVGSSPDVGNSSDSWAWPTAFIIPGLYWLSTAGVPDTWEPFVDTLIGPNGRDHLLFQFGDSICLLIDMGRE